MQSNPRQYIVCCDAPDFGEGDEEIKLKQLRMSIGEAEQYLSTLEQLTMTPSEIENRSGSALYVIPEPRLVAIRNETGDKE